MSFTRLPAIYGSTTCAGNRASAAVGLVVLLTLMISAAQACAEQVAPVGALPAVQASADDFGPDHTDVPFVLKNNWVVLELTLGKNAADAEKAPKLHFLLDTGASVTMLSKESLDAHTLDLGTLKNSFSGTPVSGIGDSAGTKVDKVVSARMDLGALNAEGEIIVIAMGHTFQEFGVDGVIGGNVIEHFVVEIDYERGIVRFYNAKTFQAPAPADHFAVVPITFNEANLPVSMAQITPFGYNATQARLILDTGGDDAVALYSSFVARNKWSDVLAKKVATTVAGVGGKAEGVAGRLERVNFGGVNLEQPPVNFAQSSKGMLAATETDGQLGGAVFRRFTLIFDYDRKRLYVRPNARAAVAFSSQNYFGFGPADTEEHSDGRTIGTVDPDSPAALAGLRTGDVLYSIDGKRTAGLALDALASLLHSTNAERTLDIERDGKHLTIKIKPTIY